MALFYNLAGEVSLDEFLRDSSALPLFDGAVL